MRRTEAHTDILYTYIHIGWHSLKEMGVTGILQAVLCPPPSCYFGLPSLCTAQNGRLWRSMAVRVLFSLRDWQKFHELLFKSNTRWLRKYEAVQKQSIQCISPVYSRRTEYIQGFISRFFPVRVAEGSHVYCIKPSPLSSAPLSPLESHQSLSVCCRAASSAC